MTTRRWLRFLPAVLIMAAIYWSSAQPGSQVAVAAQPLYDAYPRVSLGKAPAFSIPWLEVGHVAGYAALGAALLFAFGGGGRKAVLLALGTAALFAVVDEIHQGFVPGRSAGLDDVLIDVVAAAGTILLVHALKRLQRRIRPVRQGGAAR